MYQKMLVPLDGSELAEVVFTYVKELAGRMNMDVILLQVCPPALREFIPMQKAYMDRAADTIRRQSRAVQKKMGIEPEDKLIEVKSELTVGHPADEILRYTEENNVDLILMASHGRSGIRRWAMGSVADKILRASKAPVFLVRPKVPDETPYDKWKEITIIVPLDGSELAESALPHVEALAKQRGTEPIEVVLLRVSETPAMPAYYAPELSEVPLNWAEYAQQETVRRKRVAAEYLAGIEQRFKDSKINVRSEVLEGKPTDEIVAYVPKNPFSVVVMATHGRAGLSRWVHGSVAEYVVLGVSNPVLLIGPCESTSQ
jgi:nucleotide-binding universal stress UspA family protein